MAIEPEKKKEGVSNTNGEAIALVTVSKPHVVIAYACPKCKTVAAGVGQGTNLFTDEQAKQMAERHCGPWTCEVCGKEHTRSYQPTCSECFSQRWSEHKRRQEEVAFAKAEKISSAEYDGPVYWEDGEGDGFFADVEEMIDSVFDDDTKPPPYVWACTVSHPQLNVDAIVESMLEEMHEDAYVNDEQELKDFAATWNEKQTSQIWEPDYSRAVVISYFGCDEE